MWYEICVYRSPHKQATGFQEFADYDAAERAAIEAQRANPDAAVTVSKIEPYEGTISGKRTVVMSAQDVATRLRIQCHDAALAQTTAGAAILCARKKLREAGHTPLADLIDAEFEKKRQAKLRRDSA